MTGLDDEGRALVALGQALQKAHYTFVTVSPETHRRVLERGAKRREFEARTVRDVFGWSKPFDETVLTPEMLDCLRQAAAVEPAGNLLRSRVRFSTLDNLLFVHSAFPTSGEDAVFFGPDTYRFCSLLRRAAPRAQQVVDIGCGSGAGGIVLARSRPVRVVLADVNEQALRFARVNAALAGLRPEIVQSDVLQSVSGQFDLVVANPPYMQDAATRAYRHGGGQYGEALSVRIVREALPRVANGGTLIVYTGTAVVNGVDTFEMAVRPTLASSARASHVHYEEIDPDVFGEELESSAYAEADRIAAVGLTVRVSGE